MTTRTRVKRASRRKHDASARRLWRFGSYRGVRVVLPAFDVEAAPAWDVLPRVQPVPKGAGRSAVLSRDAVLRRALGLVDIVSAYVALLFAVIILGRGAIHLRPAILLLAPFVVLISKAIGLYDRDQHTLRKTTVDETPSILQVSVFCALAVWLAEALLFRGWLGRPEVFALVVANFTLITAGRWLARGLVIAITPAERCIILGNADNAARIATRMAESPGVNATVLGRVRLEPNERSCPSGPATVGDIDSLARVVHEHAVERVIIAPSSDDQEQIHHAIRMLTTLGVSVSVLPRLLEVVGFASTFDDVDGIMLLGVRQYGLSRSSQFLKRSMDIVVAAVILVLLAPLLAVLVAIIKLDSPGPALFRQPRIGRRGRLFWMIKFRSMTPDADQLKAELRERNEAGDGLFKISDDPRVTRIGRFLRRTSLDELPQLLNVLAGDMSLVGPRPLIEDEDALIEGWQRRRLAVKPGMTGLWQIFGSSRIPMNEMVKIDYLYCANWSIWLDLKVLIRTIPYVLSRRGL